MQVLIERKTNLYNVNSSKKKFILKPVLLLFMKMVGKWSLSIAIKKLRNREFKGKVLLRNSQFRRIKLKMTFSFLSTRID